MINLRFTGEISDRYIESIRNRFHLTEHNYGNAKYLEIGGNGVEGEINLIQISKEVKALFLNLKSDDDLCLDFVSPEPNCVNLLYCLQGSLLQSFKNTESTYKLHPKQNILIHQNSGRDFSLILSKGSRIAFSFYTYNYQSHLGDLYRDGSLYNALDRMKLKKGDSANSNHYGRICIRAAKFAETYFNNSYSNVPAMLLKDASVLSLFASQLADYVEEINSPHNDSSLKMFELDQVMAVESFIVDNISEELSLDKLLRICGIAPAKLQEGFRYLYNDTVASYITTKRVERAAHLLTNTELTVSEIVYSIGLYSRSYFSKIFKKRYGVSPRVFKSNHNVVLQQSL